MARSLSGIYGMDDNDFADGIAADALKPTSKEDIWGATFDQGARAKGNVDENPDASAKSKNESDSRAKPKGN